MDNDERIILFDGFTLDLVRGCVVRAGEPVHLRPQTYEVLKYLVENQGRLISKDKLIEDVWQGRAVTDGSLVKCIEEVREALGPASKQFFRNVRGRGYIFEAGTAEPESGTSVSTRSEQVDFVRVVVEEETELTAPAVSSAQHRGVSFRTVALVVAIVLVVSIATIFGVYRLISNRQSGNSANLTVPFREMEITRLTTSGKITHATISPDGKYVAHVTEDAEGDSLWLRQVGAPSSVRVAGPAATEYVSVTFAPEGDSVYYLTLGRDKGNTTLYRVPVLGGPSRMVAYDTGPIGFSPDGKQMAFVRKVGDGSHLILTDAEGKGERALATRQEPEFFRGYWNAPAWSPDGKTIACQVRLNDDRGQYETVVSINVKDGQQNLVTSKRWFYTGQPLWLSQTGLLLTANESATAPIQIWHVELNGEVRRITNDLSDYHDLSLTRDSKRLSAVQDHSVSSIWIAPEADANRAKQIASDTGWIEEMAWTPDGRVVYRSNSGGKADIWVMNADGSNQKQLTVDAQANRGLTISPDGRYIFFASDRAGRFNIWRVDADGSNLKQLTFGDDEFYPEATPDSQWVVYQRGVLEPRLWRVSVSGGESKQLTETRAVRPAVSRDGRLIAYHYLDGTNTGRWRIGVISYEGGEPSKHFDFPPTVVLRVVRWLPDRQTIAFVNNPGGLSDIWTQSLDGTSARQLTNFKAEQITAFDWSKDGHSLAFVRGVETSDVVIMSQLQR